MNTLFNLYVRAENFLFDLTQDWVDEVRVRFGWSFSLAVAVVFVADTIMWLIAWDVGVHLIAGVPYEKFSDGTIPDPITVILTKTVLLAISIKCIQFLNDLAPKNAMFLNRRSVVSSGLRGLNWACAFYVQNNSFGLPIGIGSAIFSSVLFYALYARDDPDRIKRKKEELAGAELDRAAVLSGTR